MKTYLDKYSSLCQQHRLGHYHRVNNFQQAEIGFLIRGPIKIKNVQKSGKSPKGGGVSEKNKKIQNLKFGLFDKRGESKFSNFSQM